MGGPDTFLWKGRYDSALLSFPQPVINFREPRRFAWVKHEWVFAKPSPSISSQHSRRVLLPRGASGVALLPGGNRESRGCDKNEKKENWVRAERRETSPGNVGVFINPWFGVAGPGIVLSAWSRAPHLSLTQNSRAGKVGRAPERGF